MANCSSNCIPAVFSKEKIAFSVEEMEYTSDPPHHFCGLSFLYTEGIGCLDAYASLKAQKERTIKIK